ncbi:serine hydrolase domain-containing protein [Aquisalinus flavus]|uniref:Beta-lactamase-related domain-containing protein n=1 Tax=Aquisalinus flavus TaxID=1526572 RepID=A0A8J2V6W1_9PROT|nr:serine hydrolase [Aquisalinus flavus]MBD0426971.1 serine hydrolase [Aquisalinus flavus]UNE46806.1 serine hydrolase [Aquisalinus flavus]GGC97345.1 hypothetical protein GCM10011342_02840 [Aquisalinus flavus]
MTAAILKGAGAILLLVILVFAAWFFRPWAPYSPFDIIWNRETGDRVDLYRRMEEMFPHRIVEGAENAEPLRRAIKAINETYDWNGQEKTIDQYAAESDTTALMVVKDGRVVFERYYQGEEAESRHTSWSVAKSYVATLVGMALMDGTISSLDDPVSKYVPAFEGTDYGSTSLRHLLMMSSGIDFIEDYETRGSDMRKLFFDVFIMNADVDAFVKPYRRNRPAGTDLDYLSPNSHVLSMVLREAYGKPLAQIASEKIFKPLGMADGTWLIDRNAADGKEIGYCCLQTRAEDYARFGQLYLQDGMWRGERLLPVGWTDMVSVPPTEVHEAGSTHHGERGYGLHFWIPEDPAGEYFANGYNGQSVFIDPVNDVVVVKTGADMGQIARRSETTAVLRALARAVQ